MVVDLKIRPGLAEELSRHSSRSRLKSLVEKLLAEVGQKGSEVSLVICDDPEIAELNELFRGKSKPTDVLSFPLGEGEGSEFAQGNLGDIVISLPRAVQQATDAGIKVEHELVRLLIHGMLHLLGFDHEGVSKTEATRMRKYEQVLFNKLIGR